ncbi:AIPR family protein [Pseudomonas sp. rhizo66]|uniref:AIPR family protein n=1 Tax=Pseudomonas sp. rhizo66 TaxID=3059674 RepID=UPI0028912FE4|nr:AIPR family protein [Pseudomonas sp. rhizo66]MDT3314126.1 AIPR family protein [Pseudomonas sp. rhizo66]
MALSPTQKTPAQRKELLAAIDSLAKRGGISRDRALAAWYASTLLGIDEDEAIDAASVDGPEDAGCDFIYIDDDQQTIYVLQGYVSERSDKSAGLKKWNALIGAVASVKDPIMFQYAGRNDIYDRLTDGDTEGYSMVFGLVTLAAKSDTISRNREATVRSKSYGDVSFFYEYQDTLYDKYLVVKAADRNVPQDNLQFNGGIAELRGEFGYSIVGSVYAGELFRLYSQYENQLFEGNVRLFIGQRKGGINEKIVETAENRHGDFWALNNGITIVADSFEQIGENKYTIRSFSIVNGCQTTVSLSKAIENNPSAGQSQVLVRVVAAKKALLTDIVRYNNTQNPVKLAAVRLLDPIQESLRTSFSSIDYTYAPKQEGARVMKNSKRIELDKAAQYLAAMSDDTILEAVTRKMELFDRFYKMVFPRGLTAEKVFLAWLIAHEVEVERSALLNAAGVPSDKVMKIILGIHGTPWGIFVANFLVDRLGTDVSKLTLKKMTGDDFKNAIAKYSRKAMELYSEIAVSIVSSDDEAASVRNEIRVKPFLDKLKRTLALKLNNSARWKLPKLHNVSS